VAANDEERPRKEQHPGACWTWRGHTINGDGYVTIKVRGQDELWYTHRLAKLLEIGVLPANVAQVAS
jgi:hypothetical protein